MKFMSDFVTNSSSSSFICAFKSEKDFISKMGKFAEDYPSAMGIVYRDILENKKTRKEILESVKESIYKDVDGLYIWGYESPMRNYIYEKKQKDKNYWPCTDPIIKKEINKEVSKRMKEFEESLPKRAMYSEVEYGDCPLEYDIMPYQDFVIKVCNHH